jgi:hypothetical protein
VRPGGVVVLDVLRQDLFEVAAAEVRVQSRHSVRTVRTHRSA